MREAKHLEVRTFGVALYLLACDIRPVSARRDSTGVTVFMFPPEAAYEITQYRADKAYLSEMAAAAR